VRDAFVVHQYDKLKGLRLDQGKSLVAGVALESFLFQKECFGRCCVLMCGVPVEEMRCASFCLAQWRSREISWAACSSRCWRWQRGRQCWGGAMDPLALGRTSRRKQYPRWQRQPTCDKCNSTASRLFLTTCICDSWSRLN